MSSIGPASSLPATPDSLDDHRHSPEQVTLKRLLEEVIDFDDPEEQARLKKPKRKQFRVRAKRLLVTWSQIGDNFDFDGLKDFLEQRLGATTCSRAGRELHPTTGGYHVHWFGESKKDFVINHPRELDYCDIHPNIEPIRVTPWIAADYPLKDGDVLFDEGTPPIQSGRNQSDKWAHVMAAKTKDEFWALMREKFPKETICNFNSVKAYADWQYRPDSPEYVSPSMHCHCEEFPQLTDWVQNELRSDHPGRRKSLVLFGGTLLGKSLWARSLGRHAYFPGLFMLDGFDDSVEYAIFDDMADGLNGVPNFKYWLGCQKEFVMTDKYRKKQKVKWGKPSIFIANENPRLTASLDDGKWLDANCIFVDITHYLAHALDKEDQPIIERHLACQYCQ